MTNLALDLREAAQMYPDRPAVRLDDTTLSYAQLDDLSARAAGWLRSRGLRPGEPVGIMLPNVPHFPVFYYAVLRAGGAAAISSSIASLTVTAEAPARAAPSAASAAALSAARTRPAPESPR